MNEAAIAQWATLLTTGLGAGAAGAVTSIKTALAAAGIEADTAQLEFVIADAAKRKDREDAILGRD